MEKIRVLIVNDNLSSVNTIENLLNQFKEIKIIGKALNGKEAVDIAFQVDPDIILMDTNMPVVDGFTAAEKISSALPYMGVILTGPAESSDVMRKAMQSGAADFLDLPLSSEKLYNAILTLYKMKNSQRTHFIKNSLKVPTRHPRVISFFSSKGGVGKSTLSVNTAVALRQITKKDILLIDLDLQFGDIADMLNINSKVNIVDMLSAKENLDIDDFERYIITHKSGIKILTAPRHPEQADIVQISDIKDILSLFRKMFEYIIIDLPPLLNEITLGTIEISDHMYLIAAMEIPTLKKIKSGLDILSTIGYSKEKITLVLNKYRKNSEIQVKDIKKFFQIENIMYVNDNPQIVSSSINMGEAFVTINKNKEITKQIFQLCNHVLDSNDKQEIEKNSFFEKFRTNKTRGVVVINDK